MAAAAVPIIAAAIPAIAGLFGGRGKTQNVQSSQHQTQSGEQFGNQKTIYDLNPFQQQLSQMFTQGAMDQYRQSANLAPYASQQMQNIAGQGAANTKVLSNILAQRGLSYSPAAATGLVQNAMNTGNQLSQFQAGLPMLQQQMRNNALTSLMDAFKTMPTNVSQDQYSTSRQSGDMTGTNIQQNSGNMLGGFLTGLGSGLFAPASSGGGSNLDAIIRGIRGLGGGGGAKTPGFYGSNVTMY